MLSEHQSAEAHWGTLLVWSGALNSGQAPVFRVYFQLWDLHLLNPTSLITSPGISHVSGLMFYVMCAKVKALMHLRAGAAFIFITCQDGYYVILMTSPANMSASLG